jgi:hypothetical protein
VSGAQAACERAAHFVASFGDEPSRRRAAVLAGAEPAANADAALASWAERTAVFHAESGADPLAALPVLRALADLRMLDRPLGRRLAEALARAQAADGAFGREASDEAERVFVTGRIAGALAGLRSVRRSVLDAAADYLASRFTPDRVGGFAWPPLAAYAACFANVAHEQGDEVLQWCGRELERGFRARRFDAVQVGRILVDCCAASIPGARIAAHELILALQSEQAADGGWPLLDGGDREARVQHALDGLTALVRLG